MTTDTNLFKYSDAPVITDAQKQTLHTVHVGLYQELQAMTAAHPNLDVQAADVISQQPTGTDFLLTDTSVTATDPDGHVVKRADRHLMIGARGGLTLLNPVRGSQVAGPDALTVEAR